MLKLAVCFCVTVRQIFEFDWWAFECECVVGCCLFVNFLSRFFHCFCQLRCEMNNFYLPKSWSGINNDDIHPTSLNCAYSTKCCVNDKKNYSSTIKYKCAIIIIVKQYKYNNLQKPNIHIKPCNIAIFLFHTRICSFHGQIMHFFALAICRWHYMCYVRYECKRFVKSTHHHRHHRHGQRII